MHKKNWIIVALVLIFILLASSATLFLWQKSSKNSTTYSSSATGQAPATLRIESEYWPGAYWVEVAYKKGWFKDEGLNVQLIDATDDYNQALQNMVDGKMEENNFTLYDLMKFNAKGSDLVAVIDTDQSSGTESLITTNQYKSITDLKGKR